MRFKSTRNMQPELVASKEKHRPVLTKIHLDAEKAQVVVTDSYMLARFPVELDEGDTSGPIPVDALKACRKPPEKHGPEVHIRANSHIEVAQFPAQPYLTTPRDALDYTYPNVDQLVPDNIAEFRIGVNADKLYKLAKAMGCGPNDGIELRFTKDAEGNPSALKPILVSPLRGDGEGNNPDGVLMPIRIP